MHKNCSNDKHYNRVNKFQKTLLFIIVLSIVFVFSGFPVSAQTENNIEEPSGLYAQSAVLIDGDTGRILFGKNENDILPMASTTKIMTCILTLENTDISDVATVSAYAASMPEVSLDLAVGQTCTIENLLYSMMLESHNDSAVVIAEHIAGSVEAFAKMMNDKAKEIGCNSTFFVTPNGLDGEAADENGQIRGHSTTAADLAMILRYCMKISPAREQFINITTTPSWQFTDTQGRMSVTLSNHNSFLTKMPGASSGKTGFTGKAGYCYVGSVVNRERTYIVALLACGWPNNKTYKWSDMRRLINYGMEYYTVREIEIAPQFEPVAVGNAVDEINALHSKKMLPVAVDISDDAALMRVLMRPDEEITVTPNVITEIEAPVEAGQMAGTVIYSLDDVKLGEYPVIFSEGIERISLLWCLQKVVEKFLQP